MTRSVSWSGSCCCRLDGIDSGINFFCVSEAGDEQENDTPTHISIPQLPPTPGRASRTLTASKVQERPERQSTTVTLRECSGALGRYAHITAQRSRKRRCPPP